MRLLLDSSGSELVAALADAVGVIAEVRVPTGTSGSRDIGAVAGQVLGELNMGDLIDVTVGLGPGSFIGTRVAISYANGLAAGAPGLKLCGVDSLQAIAALYGKGGCVVLRDARRGEVYAFAPSEPEAASRLIKLGELTDLLKQHGAAHAVVEAPPVTNIKSHQAHVELLELLGNAGVATQSIPGVPAEGLRRAKATATGSYLEPVYLRGFL